MFKTVAFKIIVNNSTIRFISILAFVDCPFSLNVVLVFLGTMNDFFLLYPEHFVYFVRGLLFLSSLSFFFLNQAIALFKFIM